MTMFRDAAKKAVAGIYSVTASRLYEPVVVKRAFPLFGGDLNQLALEQGRRAVASAAGRPVLDMPVGTGFFAVEHARDHEGIVVGSDIARGMVVETAVTAAREGVPNLVAVQADAHRLPFADRSFASVLCTNGLQVMPGLRPSLTEMYRVLEPEGTLYASVITVPLSGILPRNSSEHLPTLLRRGIDIADEMSAAGFFVTQVESRRLATLIEATRPA